MNSGPSGFAGAPVSKALAFGVSGASLTVQLARAWQTQTPHALDSVLRLFSYQRLGGAIFGVGLLYYFRLLERQWGSNKYGSLTCMVIASTAGVQRLAVHALHWPPSSGPTALVAAHLVSFAADVPSSWQASFVGAPFSDKAIIYLASAQLLLGASKQTLLGAAVGAAVGLAFRCNLFGLQRVRVPAAVTRFLSHTASRLSLGSHRSPPTLPDGPTIDNAGGSEAAHTPSAPPLPAATQQALAQLEDMGFDHAAASRALQLAGGDIQMALSHLM